MSEVEINATETTTEDNQQELNSPAVDDKTQEPAQLDLSSADIEKYKRDMLRYKDKAASVEAELAERKKRELIEKGRWEDLAKENASEAKEWRDKYDQLNAGVKYDKKASAVKTLALASGLRKEALADLELLDFEDVDLEITSTGRVNVLNADRAVESLKQTRPHWFSSRRPSVNSNDPGVVPDGGALVSYADIRKAEIKAQQTGNYKEYQSLLMKYKEQNRS